MRVIYYYHSANIPLFLITIFAKSQKETLTNDERNQMRKLTARLAKYGEQDE